MIKTTKDYAKQFYKQLKRRNEQYVTKQDNKRTK